MGLTKLDIYEAANDLFDGCRGAEAQTYNCGVHDMVAELICKLDAKNSFKEEPPVVEKVTEPEKLRMNPATAVKFISDYCYNKDDCLNCPYYDEKKDYTIVDEVGSKKGQTSCKLRVIPVEEWKYL